MKPIFTIGHFSIYLFGIFIALGLIVGYTLTIFEAKRKKLNQDSISNFIMFIIVFGIIGARLYYVIAFNPNYYLNNPKEILAFRDGGLSIQGALIGGILFALIYAKIKKINIWKIGDLVAPGLILGQAIGRVGCDVFGIEMEKNFFWGVNINGQLLHPTQIYESILNYILFGIIWSKRKNIKYDGQLFFIYLIGFSINRFIVEFFRTNPIVISNLTIAHVTSVVIIIISIIFMNVLRKKNENSKQISKDNQIKLTINYKEVLTVFMMIIVSVTIYYYTWR